MMNDSLPSALSPQFAARLERLAPQQRVRAIVLLRSGEGNGRRQSKEKRQETIANVRAVANNALGEIDTILERHNGKRLSAPNALGSIPVETTAAGIHALSHCPLVQAILEDQAIALPSATVVS
jgi:hypothetical protein